MLEVDISCLEKVWIYVFSIQKKTYLSTCSVTFSENQSSLFKNIKGVQDVHVNQSVIVCSLFK